MTNQNWSTVDERAALIEDMIVMCNLDPGEFAYLQSIGPEDKTQYRTTKTMVRKPVRAHKLGISFKAVELHVDFCRAFQNGRFREAVNFYFQLLNLLGR